MYYSEKYDCMFETEFDEFLVSASEEPWYDPDNEMWMNRQSYEKEFAYRQKMVDEGKWEEYLRGDFNV